MNAAAKMIETAQARQSGAFVGHLQVMLAMAMAIQRLNPDVRDLLVAELEKVLQQPATPTVASQAERQAIERVLGVVRLLPG